MLQMMWAARTLKHTMVPESKIAKIEMFRLLISNWVFWSCDIHVSPASVVLLVLEGCGILKKTGCPRTCGRYRPIVYKDLRKSPRKRQRSGRQQTVVASECDAMRSHHSFSLSCRPTLSEYLGHIQVSTSDPVDVQRLH